LKENLTAKPLKQNSGQTNERGNKTWMGISHPGSGFPSAI